MEEKIREEIYQAFRKMKEQDFVGAEALLREGLGKAELEGNNLQQGLFCSTFGVLYKMKGEMREAWRYYDRAEKLIPDDPSLKIIIASFLIDQFGQYDTAIKKAQAVLKLAKGSPSFEHQGHALLAIAYLKKGEKKKATEMLKKAMADDFEKIISAENINFEVVAAFLSRQLEPDLCREYIEKALVLAKGRKEEKPIQFLTKLLQSFEVTLPGVL